MNIAYNMTSDEGVRSACFVTQVCLTALKFHRLKKLVSEYSVLAPSSLLVAGQEEMKRAFFV